MDYATANDVQRSFSSAAAIHSGPVVVEDLIEGLNEWRNIQDIVRITFKAFHDVLKAQGDAIKTLERALDAKASTSDVATALQQKASTAEVAQRLRELEGQLMAKADDPEDVDRRALKSELDAALNVHMSDVYAVISTKADDAETRVWKEQVDRSQQQLRGEMVQLGQGLHDVALQLDQKANAADVADALTTKVDVTYAEQLAQDNVDRKVLSEALAQKADRAVVDEVMADVQQRLERKADLVEAQQIQQRLENTAAATTSELRTIRASLDGATAELKRAVDLQGSRLSEAQVSLHSLQTALGDLEGQCRDALATKVDGTDLQVLLASKVDLAQVNEALANKANVATVRAIIDKVEEVAGLAKLSEVLQHEVSSKADTKDVCTLLESKANIEDVNRALLQVCQELEGKAAVDEVGRVVKEQAIINASLCADMSLARWLWKSGKTKQGGAVPWNVEALNSDPANFLWEQDKATITTVVPGLYEVTFGFFSKKKPTVQLLVNGEPVLSAVNSSSYVIHHSSGRLATVSAHPAGNVTGLTCIDFLSLPPKAKLAITYQGEEKGEGFFSVKKL